jgi:hypothetical protein
MAHRCKWWQMTKTKTIFVTITGGYSIRNVLRTNIFKILKSRKDLKIVIFTPLFNDKNFISEFKAKNVSFHNLYCPNLAERAIHKVADMVFLNTIDHVETIKVREMMLKSRSYIRYVFFKIVKKILGKDKNFIIALTRLDNLFFKHKQRELFEKYRPALLFSTDFLHPGDWGLIKIARGYGVPIISLMANWDHPTKGILPKCDKVIVWSKFQMEQLVKYHGYDPQDIMIAGIPHSDYFVRYKGKFLSKKVLMRKIGGGPNKKLVTYTTASAAGAPHEQEIIEIICNAIKKGKIVHPAHLHVRFHPADDINRYKHLKKFGEIVTFEEPGRFASNARDIWFPSEKDMIHYANLLARSDVLVNVASTVSLDAAMLDTPIVNIAFDRYKKKFFESNTRYFKTTHYVALVKTGAVSVARNADELINFINMYLSNPKLNKEERKRAVKEQCYKVDGRVEKRIVKYILDFLDHKN